MGNSNLSPVSGLESDGHWISVEVSSQLLIGAVILLFLIVIFTFFLYLYARAYWLPRIASSDHAHFMLAAGDAPTPRHGLDAGVLRSLPAMLFKRGDYRDGVECSVCLCELSEGEEARLLPKCGHVFHLECIDMWFHSHSSCPLCRCQVIAEAAASGDGNPPSTAAPAHGQSTSAALPANVQFLGNHLGRSLAITIPNRFAEGLDPAVSPLATSNSPAEKMKSPVEVGRSPGTSKFGSLITHLSRGKRSDGSSCSKPVECDVEKGLVVRSGVTIEEGSSNFPVSRFPI